MLDPLDSYSEKVNFDLYFIPYPQINSRWIMDLNVNSKKKIKPREENRGEHIHDLGVKENIKSTNYKTDKWDFTKTTNFCSSKDIFKRVKRQAKDLEHVFNNILRFRIPKEFLKINKKKKKFI